MRRVSALINASGNMGVYPRFAAGCLARNRVVLTQDDDLVLPPETIAGCSPNGSADPDIIHGIFGRDPNPRRDVCQGRLAGRGGSRDVCMVLTRAMIFRREYCGDFFSDMRTHFDPVQESGRPYGNGEDIMLSYLVRKRTGRLNRIHGVPWKELPAPHAIYTQRGHKQHRTRLLQACEEWLRDPCTCRDRTPRPALKHERTCPIRLTFFGEQKGT